MSAAARRGLLLLFGTMSGRRIYEKPLCANRSIPRRRRRSETLSIDERATTRKEEGEGELEGWRGEVVVVARDRKFAPPSRASAPRPRASETDVANASAYRPLSTSRT